MRRQKIENLAVVHELAELLKKYSIMSPRDFQELIKFEAIFNCRKCGYSLRYGVKTCPNCGAPVEWGRCDICGKYPLKYLNKIQLYEHEFTIGSCCAVEVARALGLPEFIFERMKQMFEEYRNLLKELPFLKPENISLKYAEFEKELNRLRNLRKELLEMRRIEVFDFVVSQLLSKPRIKEICETYLTISGGDDAAYRFIRLSEGRPVETFNYSTPEQFFSDLRRINNFVNMVAMSREMKPEKLEEIKRTTGEIADLCSFMRALLDFRWPRFKPSFAKGVYDFLLDLFFQLRNRPPTERQAEAVRRIVKRFAWLIHEVEASGKSVELEFMRSDGSCIKLSDFIRSNSFVQEVLKNYASRKRKSRSRKRKPVLNSG